MFAFVQIYPSALRALRQREQELGGVRCSSSVSLGRGQDSELRAGRKTHSAPALTKTVRFAAESAQRDNGGNDWQTEYEREFRPYEPFRYQTARHDKAIHVRNPDLLPSTPRFHRSYLSIS
jgi:hypothetical protein